MNSDVNPGDLNRSSTTIKMHGKFFGDYRVMESIDGKQIGRGRNVVFETEETGEAEIEAGVGSALDLQSAIFRGSDGGDARDYWISRGHRGCYVD